MGKIVLLSCVSKKLAERARAEELYVSPLFKLGLAHAKSLGPDKIFILSAKYGLVGLDDEIEPYNETLNKMPIDKRKAWAKRAVEELAKETDLEKDEFVFLAGERYREYLVSHMKNFRVPMRGLGIGRQLKWLKENTGDDCGKLHGLFSCQKRFEFPFDEDEIPNNGIYILFEKGELGHSGDRIVRVGTHTGENQLPSRLKQHFLNENKDRSIFRKNIGRALLNGSNDEFLEFWEIDLTTRDAKEKYSHLIDFDRQEQIEMQVSKYIRENFSFIVFAIDDVEKRLEIESKIISTISKCNTCKPSKNWLGLNSPKEKIRMSGLWLVNELYKEPLSGKDFIELESLIKTKMGECLGSKQ